LSGDIVRAKSAAFPCSQAGELMYYGDNTNKFAGSYNEMAMEAYRLGNLL